MISIRTYRTPVGPLAVLVDDHDATPTVIAAGFCPADDLLGRLPADHAARPRRPVDELASIDRPVQRYLAGDGDALAEVAVHQEGTEFQKSVWAGLRAIPAGSTRTYGQLATMADHPRAVRAVGSACGANLIAPFVPCHRVLRSDGSVGGYLYGPTVKRWLLELEGNALDPGDQSVLPLAR